MAKKSISRKISDAPRKKTIGAKQADKMEAIFKCAPALLSDDELSQIQQWLQEQTATRGCALALVTKPAKWLAAEVQKDREFAIAVSDVAHFGKQNLPVYQRLSELMQAASIRADISLLYRDDAAELDKLNADRRALA